MTLATLRRIADERDLLSQELRVAVHNARQSGASIRVIAEHSGLSTSTIQDWLKQD